MYYHSQVDYGIFWETNLHFKFNKTVGYKEKSHLFKYLQTYSFSYLK